LVTDIKRESLAQEKSIALNDIIIEVESNEITCIGDFLKHAMGEHKRKLVIYREGIIIPIFL
jgi:hypothetical protein